MLTAGSASHCCYNSGRDTWNGTQGLTGTGQALCQWTLTPAFKFQMSKYLQRTWNYVTTSVVWSVERMNQSGDTVASTMSKSPSRTWWLKWQPLKFKKLLASNWFGLFLLLNTCQLKIFIISMVYGWEGGPRTSSLLPLLHRFQQLNSGPWACEASMLSLQILLPALT